MRKIVPAEDVIYESIARFLEPIRPLIFEDVEKVIQALDGGRRPDRAGQVFAEVLKDHFQNVKATEQEKHDELYQIIRELQQRLTASQQELQSKQREMNSLNEMIREKQKAILDLQNIIARQNRLLADQHDQIANLCGLQEDDAHA